MKIDFQYNVPGLIYALLIFVPIYIIIEFIFFYKKKKTKNLKKNEIIGLQINQVNKKYNFWIVLFLNEQ